MAVPYNAFGETTASSGSTVNPYRYIGQNGYQYDEETDDYYVRARTYEPAIARWVSRDPIGHEGGDNLYAYVDNNPIKRLDPSGLDYLDDMTNNWFYKWLYTGDPNISTEEFRARCEPAGKQLTCQLDCMADVNKQLIAIAAGGLGGGYTARDVLPFPKWLAKKLGFRIGVGKNPWTSIARLKSTHPERFGISRNGRKVWKNLANQIKKRPGRPGNQVRQIVRRGAKGGIAALAVLELLIALYCADKCD